MPNLLSNHPAHTVFRIDSTKDITADKLRKTRQGNEQGDQPLVNL